MKYSKLNNYLKHAYTLAEVVIVMLIIAVVVAISIKITKAKFDHITSYTYYSAFSTVRNVTAEMLNDFNAEDENYTSHEGLLAKLFSTKAHADTFLMEYNGENYWYKVVDACTIDETYPTYTFGSTALDTYAKNNISSTMKRVGEFNDIELVKNELHTGDDNVCIYYLSKNVCLYEEKLETACNLFNGEYGYKGKYSYADLPAHVWCKMATWCSQTPQYGLVWVEDAEPVTPTDPTPDPPPPPSCTPKTCTGGNVFDDTVGVCDCVCRATPPETIPCGKEWSAEQCQLVDKADFSKTCPAGQRFDSSDSVCGCKPIKPSIPIKGANYCKLFASYSNTAQLPTECSGSKVNAATAVFGGDDANVLPDLILRNGMVIYNASQNPTKIAALDGNSRGNIYTDADGNEYDLDEYGYTLYIDIDGNRSGKGVLWEDVYPFYVTLSGMTIPAYKTDSIDEFGGGSKSYLQVSLQDEYTNSSGRHVDWLLKSKSFRESACKSGYVSANSNYCSKSPALTTLAQCGQEGHDCRLKYISPYSLFKK